MRARHYVRDGLLAAHADLQIIDTLERLGEPDAARRGRVQIIRQSVEPAPEQGFYLESLDVWVVTNLVDPDELEDDLDDLTDDVTDTLRALAGVRWLTSTREMHPSGVHGYRIRITAKTH